MGCNGLADLGGLPIEVFQATAGEDQVGISFEFAASAALALLGCLIDGELVLKRQQDQAKGGNHLSQDDNAIQIGGQRGIQTDGGQRLKNEERPGQKAERAENHARREAAEHKKQQHRRHQMVGGFHKSQRPVAAHCEAEPQSNAAHHRAGCSTQPAWHASPGDTPKEAGHQGNCTKRRKQPEPGPGRHDTVKNAFEQDGINNQWNGEGDDVENLEPAHAKAQRG